MLLWSHSFQLMNFNMIRRGALREKLPLLWVGHRDQLKEAQNGEDILMTRSINRCRLLVSFLVSNPLTRKEVPSSLGLEVEVLGKVQPTPF